MKIPDKIKTFETELSVMRFNKNGILCSGYKKNTKLTRQAPENSFQLIKDNFNGKKICWPGEVSNMSSPDNVIMDFAAEETPKFVNALAILSNSAFANFSANIYFNLKYAPHP